MATAVIHINEAFLAKTQARAFLDKGSQANLITKSCVKRFDLKINKCSVEINGFGEKVGSTSALGWVDLTVFSRFNDKFYIRCCALVVQKITNALPTKKINTSKWHNLKQLALADPDPGTPAPIDVLLGVDVWGEIIKPEILKCNDVEPHAQASEFGWIVFGPVNVDDDARTNAYFISAEKSLEELLEKFWQQEEICIAPTFNDEEMLCEKIFAETVERNRDGRYVVQLPFKLDAGILGNSYNSAYKQFMALERRLYSNPELKSKYTEFMREYISLNHMALAEKKPLDESQVYYIPHHPVRTDEEDKFRIVFNASSKTSTGISLNDTQLVGPTLQDNLVDIIMRFRRYQFAFNGDIAKMYRQILIHEKHRDWQRILWREENSQPLLEYQLLTVTYGTTSGSYNAVKAMRKCALDYLEATPVNISNGNGRVGEATNNTVLCTAAASDRRVCEAAVDSILRDFYVDDYLASEDTVEKAIEITQMVSKILWSGKMEVRKWNSNSIEVIESFPVESRAPISSVTLAGDTTTVLGLKWHPYEDELAIVYNLIMDEKSETKREILRDIAKLYDPLGLLAPVIILAKIFMQDIWREGIDWDEKLPDHLLLKWKQFRSALADVLNIRIPRWMGMAKNAKITLHGYSDASLKAYAAVIYVRVINSNGQISTSLVASKTKVSPVKPITIPRLELCGAQLLVNLLVSTKKALQLENVEYYLATDSTIVLAWLRKSPSELKTYVCNRVSFIQSHTKPDSWHHIPTSENPADCASRGLLPNELKAHALWWNGPEYLKSAIKRNEANNTTLEQANLIASEVKPLFIQTFFVQSKENITIKILNECRSLKKAQRIVAYMLRWRHKNLRNGPISVDEYRTALQILIKGDQQFHFCKEMNLLANDAELPNNHSLNSLCPLIDSSGILRVGGRLRRSEYSYDTKHPIILAKESRLSELLIREVHFSDTIHGGTSIVLNKIRTKYWPLGGRQKAKQIINRCTACTRYRNKCETQQMSDLPMHRVIQGKPFLRAAVDFCGPIYIRSGLKRSKTVTKGYIAVFVCMATKAMHLELVSDLTSDAFLAALERLRSTRGIITDIYSDNGTNFVGGNRQLQKDIKLWRTENTENQLAIQGIKWHFIAPRSPWWGGLWESAVRSTKHHLRRLLNGHTLHFEQLATVLKKIEAILNSRPMLALSDDVQDRLALTPGDILTGAPILATPEPNLTEIPINRLKQWRLTQRFAQEFWQRWHTEYLNTLQQRHKWQKKQTNLKIGDIVLIKEENYPPTHWPLARVIGVYPGQDNLVRVVSLKTKKGILKRAVQKLCLLPTEEEQEAADSETNVSARPTYVQNT